MRKVISMVSPGGGNTQHNVVPGSELHRNLSWVGYREVVTEEPVPAPPPVVPEPEEEVVDEVSEEDDSEG